MWEWFIRASERHKYYSQTMEGAGGGGPVPEKTVGWLWGFGICAGIVAFVVGFRWLFS